MDRSGIRGPVLTIIIAAVLAAGPAPAAAAPAGDGPGEGAGQKLRVVELEGTPYEIGLTHGRALKAEIGELVGRWKTDLAVTYKVPAETFIKALLERTDFKPSIERWTPGLLDEVRGIADGAGMDFDTLYAFQLIDEIWVAGPDMGFAKCTSVAAGPRQGRPAFVAQTLDIPTFYLGYQTVLRIKEGHGAPGQLIFTIPGIISSNGLNDRAVGVCVNAVTQLAYSPKGLPVAFAIRGILRRRTFEEAVGFLREIRPAAPQNYVIGGPGGVADFERSAGKMVRFVPFEGAEFTYHTNHPLLNEDLDPKFVRSLKDSGMPLEAYRAHCPRLNFLRRMLKDNSADTGLDALKALFRDRSSGINNEMTYGCTIMVLGEKPELHVTPGRPDEAPFEVFGFAPKPDR